MERGLSLVGFGALLLAALVLVPFSSLLMPTTVASHFAIDGTANGFMPRNAYLLLMTGLIVGMPLAMVATVGWQAQHGAGSLKLPNKDYWLAPERRADTVTYLRVHMARFGSLLIVFLGAVHGLVVRANLSHPPRLQTVPMLVLVVLFLGVTLLWLHALYGRFRHID